MQDKRPGTGWFFRIVDQLSHTWQVPGDESNRDRQLLMGHNLTGNVQANLIGGNFFTGLLIILSADDGWVGLMTILVFAANVLQLLSPYVLERFESRKRLLLSLRAIIHIINIVVISLIPLLPGDNSWKLTAVASCVFLVNAVNAVMSPGFAVWHIAHVPQRVRVQYYATVSMMNGIFVALVNLGAASIVDLFKKGGNELLGLEALRILAFLVAILDLVLLSRIRELPRTKPPKKINLVDLFVKPWRERTYLRTVAVIVLWSLVVNMPGAYYTVYLLKELNVSYSFINAVSMTNVPILLMAMPVWRRIFLKHSWLNPLSWGMLLLAPHYLLLALVTPQSLWLYPVAIIWSFICTTGINLGFTSVAYINIPEDNQTLFIGFYATMGNLAALLGANIARAYMTRFPSLSLSFGAVNLGNKQLLMIAVGALMVCVGVAVQFLYKKNRAEGRDA